MTRDQQREQEVGFLAVLCGFVSWLTIQAVFIALWLFSYMPLWQGTAIAGVTGILVTLVVGTVLLRALRKGAEDHHEKAREEFWRGRGYRQHRDWMN